MQDFPLFSFLSHLSSLKNGIPLNKLFILGKVVFNPPRGKHALKRTEVIVMRETYPGNLNFSTLFKVSQRDFFNPLQNQNGVLDFC